MMLASALAFRIDAQAFFFFVICIAQEHMFKDIERFAEHARLVTHTLDCSSA